MSFAENKCHWDSDSRLVIIMEKMTYSACTLFVKHWKTGIVYECLTVPDQVLAVYNSMSECMITI